MCCRTGRLTSSPKVLVPVPVFVLGSEVELGTLLVRVNYAGPSPVTITVTYELTYGYSSKNNRTLPVHAKAPQGPTSRVVASENYWYAAV